MAYIQYVRSDDHTETLQVVQDPVAWVLASPFFYLSPDHVNTFTDSSFRVPAVDNYVAYANMLGQLNAFNATTGWQMWSYGKMDFGSSPAVSGGVVYFYASNTQTMMALNAAATTYPSLGAQVPVLWSVPMSPAYSPVVSGGTLYAGAADGKFYALNAATGAVEWTFKTGSAFTSLQIPAISGNLIYVPGADGTLYVLQKSTGAEVWHYTGTAAWGPVVIAGGMVFASDLTNTFYAFQAQSAAIGPAVTALSATAAPVNSEVRINLTGSGFYAGGVSSAVQSIFLDNTAGTQLTGYTVTSDQTIANAVNPVGVAPGVYHIKVQTSAGTSANEPAFTIEPANSLVITTLGYSTGTGTGTNLPSQRHLGRISNGTLVAVYIGPATGDSQYPSYNFSVDGGVTWSSQGQIYLSNQGTVVYTPSTSIWVDAQDQINISSIQLPSYNETVQKFAINHAGVLSQATGFPVFPAGGTASVGAFTSNLCGPIVSEPGGRLWVAYESGPAPTGPVLAYYSDNGGLSWNSAGQINTAPGTSPVMVLYQGYPAVIYSDGGSLAWSAWNGHSWSRPQILPGPITGVAQSLSAVVTSAGQVAVAYSPANGGVYLSGYAGQSWSAAAALDTAGTSPSLTTDGTNLWAFYTNASGNLVYRQTSNGVWGAPVAVTSDGNQNTAATTLPMSPVGQIPVVWTSGSSTAGFLVKAAVISSVTPPLPPPPVQSAALGISKTNSLSFVQGQTGATYTVTVSNGTGAGPTAGTVTVTDTEPAGLTLVSMSGSGWSCSAATCTRSDVLSGGSNYPTINVTVNVAANAAATVTSQASVSGGGSASATASDVTSIVRSPALSISKTNSGSFVQGQTGATYTVTVSDGSSAGPTSGVVTVTDTEPAGLTLVSMSGNGWTCAAATCTRGDVLSGGSSYPAITVTVNVAANAAATVTSQASVSGGGSASATAADVTSIAQSCSFTYPAAVSLTNAVPATGYSRRANRFTINAITPRGACTAGATWTATADFDRLLAGTSPRERAAMEVASRSSRPTV